MVKLSKIGITNGHEAARTARKRTLVGKEADQGMRGISQ
jgi:hypothetical protein